VLEGRHLGATGQALDAESGGALTRAIAKSRFEGKKDQTLLLHAPAGLKLDRLLLVGLGKGKGFDAKSAQGLGGLVVAQLGGSGDAEVTLAVDPVEGSSLSAVEIAANAGFGAKLRSYRFDRYRTKEKAEDKPTLKKLVLAVADHSDAKKAYQPLEAVAEGVFLTRDLASEPANIIYPETLADQCKTLTEAGVEVEVLGEKQMKKLGMGALLGVGQGSERESQLVVMRWNGGTDGEAPLAFIGKGVTFDTGGISIKPAAGMGEMKWDMAGAGVVIGLMRLLAARAAKINAVGIVGLVENMPSGSAQRPGDIVKSMSGQTIEVLNTDAEGRLVLADALWYCQDRFKPALMVDLATLTGAVMVALGHEHAGLFANNDELAERLVAAGKAVGEKLWRLPLDDAYNKAIDSDAADVKNIAGDRAEGSIIGAQFVQRFVNKVPWAHLDIAGVAWSKKDAPTVPKGATAFGVRLLDRFVSDYYEGPHNQG